MAVHFHTLIVKDIRKETADCVTVWFEVPENLETAFLFKEGQNITIKANISGEEVRRSYSLCTAPHEKSIKVAIKRVDGGLFSKFANEGLRIGDKLEVLPPVGKFNSKPSIGKPGNYLAIAAGSGITPVISIIKHSLQSEPGSSFTLLYGNKSRSSIIFFEELEALKNKYIERFSFINILSREKTDSAINYGRIDAGKLGSLQSLLSFRLYDSIYICGPEKLIFGARDFLAQKGVAANKVHFELFTSPGQSQEKKQAVTMAVETDQGPTSNISVKLDGRSFDFTLGRQGEAILDAALRQGADLPYACKGGVCCSCRARLVEGQVFMDVNYALEPEEVAQGFILTCQSHPISQKVVVDFDVK